MRFHVIALPHTELTDEYSSCAYTQKVRRFCEMMTFRGHKVFLYANDVTSIPVHQAFICGSEELRRATLSTLPHYTAMPFEPSHQLWQEFNRNAIVAMQSVVRQKDFICIIAGRAQQAIVDAFPGNIAVEYGIGYAGTLPNTHHVFESYAWMHMVNGRDHANNLMAAPGRNFDAVIPNQIDASLFPETDDFSRLGTLAYLGRMTEMKGFQVAREIAEAAGCPLILAGPGDPGPGYGEYVGELNPRERWALLRTASALLAPSVYIEPFGTAAIEAMACGTPVLCPDWGGFTDTVIQGFNGYRCHTLAEYVNAVEMAGDVDHAAIRKHTLARFGMTGIGEDYECYFRTLKTLWDKGWYQID